MSEIYGANYAGFIRRTLKVTKHAFIPREEQVANELGTNVMCDRDGVSELVWSFEESGSSDTDEPWDGFNSDAEADADALASAGWGTDEDYGCFDDYNDGW